MRAIMREINFELVSLFLDIRLFKYCMFQKLYEQVAMFRTGRHGTFKDMNELNFTLTPEQLAQAKLFGLYSFYLCFISSGHCSTSC